MIDFNQAYGFHIRLDGTVHSIKNLSSNIPEGMRFIIYLSWEMELKSRGAVASPVVR